MDFSMITDETLRKQLEDSYKEEIAKATEGMYTQSELDRAVNNGVQKQLKDNREIEKQIRKQIEDEAKLSAEQKAAKVLEEANRVMSEAQIMQNRISALDKCVAAGMDKKNIDPMLDVLVSADADKSAANIDLYVKQYEAMKAAMDKQAAGGMSKPKTNGTPTVDKKAFDEMSFADKIKFKSEHPEEAALFMK